MLPSLALSRRRHPFSAVIALLVVLGMLALPVTSAMAAPAPLPAFPQALAQPISTANMPDFPIVRPETPKSSLDLSASQTPASLSLSPSVNATSTITLGIYSTPFATHDSNKPDTDSLPHPMVWVVEAVITNTGVNTITNPSFDVNMNPDGNWFLLPGESRQKNLSTPIPPGGAGTTYWFAHRADTIPDPHTYTVTVWANNVDTVTQSMNVYPNTSLQTVESRSSISTGNNRRTLRRRICIRLRPPAVRHGCRLRGAAAGLGRIDRGMA